MMKLKSVQAILSPRKLVFSLAVFVFVVTSWFLSQPLLINGLYDRRGNLIFYNQVIFNDSSVHLALIGELSRHFPAINPTATGTPLRSSGRWIRESGRTKMACRATP